MFGIPLTVPVPVTLMRHVASIVPVPPMNGAAPLTVTDVPLIVNVSGSEAGRFTTSLLVKYASNATVVANVYEPEAAHGCVAPVTLIRAAAKPETPFTATELCTTVEPAATPVATP